MLKKKKKTLILIVFLFTILLNFITINQNLPINLDEGEEPYKIENSATVSSLWNFTTGSGVSCSPALADVDGDGKLEVIVGSTDSHVYAINGEDGSLLWISASAGAGFHSSPALGDIDNDGKLEVVIGNFDNHLYALNAEDGSQLWNYSTGDDITGSPALADIDGDNMLEAVFGSYDDKIYAINGENGSLLWSYTTTSDINTSPAIGDIDNDGKLEVVIGNRGNTTYALNGEDGSVAWTFVSNHTLASSASIADLDFDGELEIVIYFIYGLKTMIYALNGIDGSVLWTYYRRMHADTVPAIGDTDNDGNLEVVFGSSLVVNGEDGSTYLDRKNDPISRPASLGDVDGDGKMELIVASMGYSVFAINIDTNTTAWEFPLPYYVISTPVLGDLDGDGELEVVFGCQDHKVYAVDITNAGNHIEWQGNSGDLIFQRRKNYNFVPNQTDQNPVCVIEPKIDNQVVTEVGIGEQFNLYMGNSYDDHEITEVRFTSDGQQDSISTGTWSSWYSWDTSSGYWDASNKKMEWLFETGGYKEIWAEVKDNNSQMTLNYANILAVYNITKDSRFSIKSYFDKFLEFGEIEMNIRLYQLKPNGNQKAYENALEEWGINLHDFAKVHNCWLLELGDFNEVFDYIESKVSNLLTLDLRSAFEKYVCDDGYIRFTFTIMSNFEEFKVATLKQIFDILLDFCKPKEIVQIDHDTFLKFEDIFRSIFDTIKGSNGIEFKCKLKPSIKKGEILFKFILNLAKIFNFELHRLDIENNVVSSTIIYDLQSNIETIEFLYHILKIAFKVAVVAVQGGANALSWVKLGAKAVTFTMDYIFHYESKDFFHILDYLYLVADFIDPPVARLDLQIKDAQTDQILLGYNPSSNSTSYSCENGFFRGDLESQFAIIHKSLLPLNICIINTHLDSNQSLIYLNQSLTFGMINSSSHSNIFSYLQSDNLFFTIMNYSEEDGLSYNQLEVNIIEQGYSWVKVNITDKNNNYIQDPFLEVFLRDNKISATIVKISNGVYNISVATEYIDEQLIVIAEKSGYFSDSAIVILGSLQILEQPPPAIPGYVILLLILNLISVTFYISIKITIKLPKTKTKTKKYRS